LGPKSECKGEVSYLEKEREKGACSEKCRNERPLRERKVR
jgi:hypothetical protein